MRTRLNLKPAIVSLALLGLMLAVTGCHAGDNFDSRLEAIAAPYGFSIARWEARTLPRDLAQSAGPWTLSPERETELVIEYFTATRWIAYLDYQVSRRPDGNAAAAFESELIGYRERKDELEATVERILERQIATVLGEEGIYNLWDSSGYPRPPLHIPPVNFQLEMPPHLLVISPRDRIESQREILLRQDLSVAEIEGVEAAADGLGVSSLVLDIGGLAATYPSFVTNDASLNFTIAAATEEWLHQYLLLQPLGILYALDLTGVAPDYEIAAINETVVGIASDEIAAIIYQRYYPAYARDNPPSGSGEVAGFDFNRVMRETRLQVDEYLAQGQVAAAEAYMEQRRQYLADNGYDIRKLNQAYFAFHGTYADSPTSVSPVGVMLRALRDDSASLQDFLVRASRLTGLDSLTVLAEQTAGISQEGLP